MSIRLRQVILFILCLPQRASQGVFLTDHSHRNKVRPTSKQGTVMLYEAEHGYPNLT